MKIGKLTLEKTLELGIEECSKGAKIYNCMDCQFQNINCVLLVNLVYAITRLKEEKYLDIEVDDEKFHC